MQGFVLFPRITFTVVVIIETDTIFNSDHNSVETFKNGQVIYQNGVNVGSYLALEGFEE